MGIHRISLDFETRSRCDLPECGAYRYAEDPSTEVLVIALSIDGGPVLTWDIREPIDGNAAILALESAIVNGWEIHAYNSQFEWCILKYVCPRQFNLPIPDISNMRCTAAVCRSAGLPPSLAAAAEFLNLDVQKDKAGKLLIKKFSVPQGATNDYVRWDDGSTFTLLGEKVTSKDAFQRFVDYCVRDVETEMALAKAMQPFALEGFPLDCFLLTARLNDRGVPVDRKALENAMLIYREREEELAETFREITGLMPNQNIAVLRWMQERGYHGSSMDAATRAACDESALPEDARRALRIKAELSFAAVKKIPAMLNWVMSDDMIRGSFIWCGAQKTWRWTSEGPQWQNMKKPPKGMRKHIDRMYQDVAEGLPLYLMAFLWGNPYEVIACLSRYFVRYKDRNVYDADFSSVEAKILPTLIGCKRILDRFGSGEDVYTTVGNKMGVDRDMGKTIVLATQFQGGWKAVFNATGKTWDKKRCQEAVNVVREENPEFQKAWAACQKAFTDALDAPGKWFAANKYCAYGYTNKAPFPRMMVKLPSGRKICLPHPKKDPITMVKLAAKGKPDEFRWERIPGHRDEAAAAKYLDAGDAFLCPELVESVFHTWELSFYGHIEGRHYGRVGCYGGDLLQSQTQAVGVDLLANGVIEAEKAGFFPFLLVHDQCLVPAVGDKDEFAAKLCTVPDWFAGFPLEATADEVRSYCKN
jgi:DNA polymerase